MGNVNLSSRNPQLNSPTANTRFLRIGFLRSEHQDCGRIDLRTAVVVVNFVIHFSRIVDRYLTRAIRCTSLLTLN